MILATSVTDGYPWYPTFAASVKRYWPNPLVTVTVPEDFTENRCRSMQHGAFVDHMGLVADNAPDPVIAFLDADMVMQREFGLWEIGVLEDTEPGEIWIGPNHQAGDKLTKEIPWLKPQCDDWVIDTLFPGWREVAVWNTGFAVARRSTWRRLRDMTRAILPAVESCFDHYACLQWAICYCVGKWLAQRELSRTIHLHGLWGFPEGAHCDAEGNAYWHDQLAVFRHAINLDPPKRSLLGGESPRRQELGDNRQDAKSAKN